MSPYEQEHAVALQAVRRAALVTNKVFHSHNSSSISKSDASPVTTADFAAQALIIASLRRSFPKDSIIAEEESSALRSNETLCNEVWELVRSAPSSDSSEQARDAGTDTISSKESMLDLIDQGNAEGGREGRVWAIDPVDGTKGFLRGGQYAVCLALIEDGGVKVGVLGCPNLPTDPAAPLPSPPSSSSSPPSIDGLGVLFSAIKSKGATSRPLFPSSSTTSTSPSPNDPFSSQSIHMRPLPSLSAGTFCESVESGHSNHNQHSTIASRLGITNASVRMDSQAKYGSIARGAGDVYLRLPVKVGYEEKIWDHAAGALIVGEAGGEVSDAEGKGLDFGVGRTLRDNRGVVAAPKGEVHTEVLRVVREVLGEGVGK